MATKLILIISTLDRDHNFLGLFDQGLNIWKKQLEFSACGSEEFFPIFKKFVSQKQLLNLKAVVIEQGCGSFSGLRLEAAIANSLKIKNNNLQLFSVKADNIQDLKTKIIKNKDLISVVDFIFPEYPGQASIHK
ncbi:MAG: hypothetical protein PHW50_00155 [Patescibacteria group bacterium]|nr:hypothetical protein [Patescibacteria group bacterium]